MIKTLEDLARRISAQPGDFAFLVGAGISMREPTFLPSGGALSEAALQACSGRLVRQITWLTQAKESLGEAFGVDVGAGQRLIRPEAVFEAYEAVCGQSVTNVLRFMRLALPNLNHRALAELHDRGASILTTNFDRLIDDLSARSEILHLHGDIDNLDAIRTTVRSITQRLSPKLETIVDAMLSNKRMLVVTGYSGGDIFDVVPALESCAYKTLPELIWIQHGTTHSPVDRGASRAVSRWPSPCVLIKADTDQFFDMVASLIKVKAPKHTLPPRGWWRPHLRRELRDALPQKRKRLLGALAIFNYLHLSRFVTGYLRCIAGQRVVRPCDLKLDKPRHILLTYRVLSRRACARGDYSRCVSLTKECLAWVSALKSQELTLVDVVDQLLLLVLNIRNFGQLNPLQYARSLIPLIRSTALLRRAKQCDNMWRRRKADHISTEWVQFFWRIGLKRLAALRRRKLLGSPTWDAEHRARLLVADDLGRSSREALDFHFDLEGFTGLENAARAYVRRHLRELPVGVLRAKAQALISSSRVFGDVVGYGKNLLLAAEVETGLNPDAASAYLRKSDWVFRRIQVSWITKLGWRIELRRVRQRMMDSR